jgi:Zn-dependent protease with chaperone function
MNFFQHQEQARRASRRLIWLFAISVLAIVIAVNLAVGFIYLSSIKATGPGFAHVTGGALQLRAGGVPLGLIVVTTLGVLLLVGGGTAYQTLALRAGGEKVASMVGGRPVDPSTRDLLERRLLNVVEEMALASGVSMPRVYVLDDQQTINAFAAGHSPNDAVVAVTRGTLTRLSRDELQGVIGHEFSHILNGDMALNLRLIGVLHGLLVLALAGRMLMEVGGRSGSARSSRDSGSAVLAMLGLGLVLWLLGYLGVLCGRIIKASVSRQREYLADASAVQFTRNPEGIGGALRKIGGAVESSRAEGGAGSAIHHPQAESLSHMFMAPARASFAAGLLATHPPLADRVKRIYGRGMTWLAAPEQPLALAMAEAAAPPAVAHFAQSPLAALVQAAPAPEQLVAQVGTAAALAPALAPASAAELPGHAALAQLHEAAIDSTRAQWVIFALLIDKAHDVRAQQRQLFTEAFGAGAAQSLDELHEQVQRLAPGQRLPLAERAVPTLKKLGGADRERVLRIAHALIVADGRVTLMEFLLFTVLKRRIGPEAGRAVPVRYPRLEPLAADVSLVLSLIAALRLPDAPQRAFEAGAAALPELRLARTEAESIALDAVGAALGRLNQLAPLAKPAFIKACAAAALVGGSTHWKAGSCLRTVCAAIDAPLPPLIDAASPEAASREAA